MIQLATRCSRLIGSTLAAAVFAFGATTASAQVANCGAPFGAQGTLTTPGTTTLGSGDFTIPPTLSGYAAGLPNFDFAIVDPNDIVFNEDSTISGARFLGANKTGAFKPSDFGLGDGDQLCINYVTYDLTVIRDAVDEILTGAFLGFPCCDVIPTFVPDIGDICAALNSAGIFSSTDVNDVNDVFALVVALGGSPSFEALQNTIDVEINPLIADGTPCTGASLLCYSFTNRICYNVVDAPVCNSAILPTNQNHTYLANRVEVTWDPQPGAVGCQAGFKRLPSGPSPKLNVLSPPYNSANVPYAAAGAGTTWTWRVRCACSISPLDAGGFTAYGDTFTIPTPRQGLVQETAELYPNPASNVAFLRITAQYAQDLDVQLADMLGRVVYNQREAVAEGENRIEIPVADLPAGVYLVRAGEMEPVVLTLQ